MERLTIRTPKGAALIMGDSYENEAAARADLMQRFLIAVNRLAAYEDADEAGRLAVLPCKVGDAAYWVHNGVITDCRVNRIQFNRAGLFICLRSKVSHGAFSVRCIGKTVFFSRQEAEEALGGVRIEIGEED